MAKTLHGFQGYVFLILCTIIFPYLYWNYLFWYMLKSYFSLHSVLGKCNYVFSVFYCYSMMSFQLIAEYICISPNCMVLNFALLYLILFLLFQSSWSPSSIPIHYFHPILCWQYLPTFLSAAHFISTILFCDVAHSYRIPIFSN